MQDTLLVEEVDCRRLDDPEDSRVLTITKLALPKITRKMVEHTPGGGVGSIKYLLPMIDALEPTIATKGLDRGAMQSFGFLPGTADTWVFAGAIRNTDTNEVLPMRAVIRGILAEWAPGEHTPGELLDCDMAFHEVRRYELKIADDVWFRWDYKGRIMETFGIDHFAKYRRALGV